MDADKQTPLHMAAWGGFEAIVGLLLDRGADIEAKDSTDHTPLHRASLFYGREATAELLVDRGADIKAEAFDGQTPLHMAARNGLEAIVGLLLDRGANIEAKDSDRCI